MVNAHGDQVGRATVQSAQALALAAVDRQEEAISLLEDAVRVLRYHGNAPAEQVARQRLAELHARRTGAISELCSENSFACHPERVYSST